MSTAQGAIIATLRNERLCTARELESLSGIPLPTLRVVLYRMRKQGVIRVYGKDRLQNVWGLVQ